MGKHKKTRQQKIIASLRRQVNLEKQTIATLAPAQTAIKPAVETQKSKFTYTPATVSQKTIPLQTYLYLPHDLLKTAILTSSIVVAEILLFLLSKNHILKLPI